MLSRAKIVNYVTNLSNNGENNTDHVNHIIISKAAHVMSNVFFALGTNSILHKTTRWTELFRELLTNSNNESLENDNANGIEDFEFVSDLLRKYFHSLNMNHYKKNKCC